MVSLTPTTSRCKTEAPNVVGRKRSQQPEVQKCSDRSASGSLIPKVLRIRPLHRKNISLMRSVTEDVAKQAMRRMHTLRVAPRLPLWSASMSAVLYGMTV
jgi:hypothetical protein